MGTFSVWHILIVAAVILLLFGGQGKISDLMGDIGRGIKAFRVGLAPPQNNPAQARVPGAERRHDAIDEMNSKGDLEGISPASRTL